MKHIENCYTRPDALAIEFKKNTAVNILESEEVIPIQDTLYFG